MDSEEKLNLTVEQTEGEDIVIRHGKANDIRQDTSLDVDGAIGSASEWYRINGPRIDNEKAHLKYCKQFNRKELWVKLITDQWRSETGEKIAGRLKVNPGLTNWKINGESWGREEFSKFVRRNRNQFTANEVAEKLATELIEFRAKYNQIFENVKQKNGNLENVFKLTVKSNLTIKNFTLQIRPFLGRPESITFEVEIITEKKGNDCIFYLDSIDLNEKMEVLVDTIFENELQNFRDKMPVIEMI